MKIVSAVLAAGGSARFRRPKQLARFRGEPLVRRAVAAASLPEIAETAVILGANRDEVARALDGPTVKLWNPSWAEGIASSIRTAVVWAESCRANAVVLLLADQPLIEAAHVRRLLSAWSQEAPAAASAYAGVLGVPAIFGSTLFAELVALQGDGGAGKLLRSREGLHAVTCPEGAVDIDTMDDLDALVRLRP